MAGILHRVFAGVLADFSPRDVARTLLVVSAKHWQATKINMAKFLEN
jgi:hypothetical protein